MKDVRFLLVFQYQAVILHLLRLRPHHRQCSSSPSPAAVKSADIARPML